VRDLVTVANESQDEFFSA